MASKKEKEPAFEDSYIHISEATEEAIKEIELRRKGLLRGAMLPFPRLNDHVGNGLQWGKAYMLVGLSGSGKSTLKEIIETGILELNPDDNIAVLNFNFETPSKDNIIKKISREEKMTFHELLSSKERVPDHIFNRLRDNAEKLKSYPIFYFDNPGNNDQVERSIMKFQKQHPNTKLLIFMDHTGLLSDGEEDKTELKKIQKLSNMSIRVKKKIGCIFFFLHQAHTEMMQPKRISNPTLHFPTILDIRGGKEIYHAMDGVMFATRPETMQITSYTTMELEVKDRMYIHVIKGRYDGVTTIDISTTFIKYNHLEECDRTYTAAKLKKLEDKARKEKEAEEKANMPAVPAPAPRAKGKNPVKATSRF